MFYHLPLITHHWFSSLLTYHSTLVFGFLLTTHFSLITHHLPLVFGFLLTTHFSLITHHLPLVFGFPLTTHFSLTTVVRFSTFHSPLFLLLITYHSSLGYFSWLSTLPVISTVSFTWTIPAAFFSNIIV